MARYVDIEPVIKRLTSVCLTDDAFGMGIQTGINRAMEIIGEARIVDAVEVVRCEECEKWIDGLCSRYGLSNLLVTRPDGYCDGGKRRSDG